MPTRYCIDASSLFTAWNEQFPPDVVPSFWERLDGLIDNGHLVAPEEVRHELRWPAELKSWAKDRDSLFRELEDDREQATITEVVERFRAEARRRGVKLRESDFKGDPFVVALARVRNAAIVSEERMPREASQRPTIPSACAWWSLRPLTLMEFVRELRWRF